MNQSHQHKFIFLCGLHRSGTSPLFRILREHPQISGFKDTGVPEDEGQHLQSVVPAAKVYGGPGQFGFAPAAHLTETSALATPENGLTLFEEWSRHWDLTRLYLLEKSPPNLIRTRFLQALFPESYFIVILRHPVAVSLATSKWTDSSLESLVEHWLKCHQLFEVDQPHLQRILVVRYENLVRKTSATIEQIYGFLGLAGHPAVSLDPDGNERYFTAWRNLLSEKESAASVRRMVSKYEKPVRHYGYSLAECEAILRPSAAIGIIESEFTKN